MTINPAEYRKHKGKKATPVMINIRLRRRGPKPTRDEIVACLEYILANEAVPSGWQLAVMNWRHPRAASSGWRSGKLQAFNDFAAVIQDTLQSARIAVVRKNRGR